MLSLNLEDGLSNSNSEKKQKKKQKLIKHKRKNWAKTDISEVEQGIEEFKQQQRTGGILAEKKDEDLFYIHKEKIQESNEDQQPRKKKRLSLEEKMKNLACYRSLQPEPNSVPAHIVNFKQPADENSKRQQRLRERQQKILSSNKRIKKLLDETKKESNFDDNDDQIDENKILKKKKKMKKFLNPVERKTNVLIEANFEKDIWNKSDTPVINEINEYYLKSTKQIIPKRPKNPLQKLSAIPPLQVPHPGASYNPDYDDHQDLLLKAHLIELEKLQKEQKEIHRLSTSVKKMSWDEIEKLWLEEMNIGNLLEDKNEVDEVNNSDDDVSGIKNISNKKNNSKESKNKRKRKQLLEKIKKDQKENEKKQRIQENEIYRLRSIKKEINDDEKKREEAKLKKEIEEKHKELFLPKRLGKLKYEEPDIELKLSEEITGNLRSLKPEGNIMLDRYKSLQKRNLVEPRERAKRFRKFWKKKFEKKNAYEKTHFIK